MARTKLAEELVGYKSGTMAPICHTTNMKVFLEETIFKASGKEEDEEGDGDGDADIDSNKEKNGSSSGDIRIVCGSGMFGQCLSISADKFLKIAELNPQGVKVCDLIKTKKAMKVAA